MPPGIKVTLPESDFLAAWASGEDRRRHHAKRRGEQVSAYDLEQEGMGAVAEAAVAQLFGGLWNGAVGRDHYGTDDVVTICGDPLEVKSTPYHTGRLLIYEKTSDNLPCVLVIVPRDGRFAFSRTVRVAGWLTAHEGKRTEWWEAGFKTPCWAVPQDALRRIEELPCMQSLLLSASRSSSDGTAS